MTENNFYPIMASPKTNKILPVKGKFLKYEIRVLITSDFYQFNSEAKEWVSYKHCLK